LDFFQISFQATEIEKSTQVTRPTTAAMPKKLGGGVVGQEKLKCFLNARRLLGCQLLMNLILGT